MNEKIRSIFGLLAIVILFILFSFLIQENLEYFKELIGERLIGIEIYIFILILATVIAPVSAMPLMPLASNLWGWTAAAIFSIIGWGLGAIIAFSLARIYGTSIIKRFISLEKLSKFEKMIPKENVFWGIVLLRMSVPVDILSYVLGLFSNISYKTYITATFIGITPFAFGFAFLGKLPVIYQIIGFFAALAIIFIGLFVNKLYRKRKLVHQRAFISKNPKS